MNYSMISLLQFIFSILVIMLHVQRIFQDNTLHYIQKSIFSRMAVPFFIVSSSFFIHQRMSSLNYTLRDYLKKMIKVYLVLSILYLPYAYLYISPFNFSLLAFPLVLFVGLVYTGFCYHLWYFPALITGHIIVAQLKKRVNDFIVGSVLFLVYIVGTLETYASYFRRFEWFEGYQSYRKVFFTTRNGIFFVPIFIYMGYILYKYRHHSMFSKNYTVKLLVASCLFLLEAIFIYFNQGDDKNFFVALVPFSTFLMNWATRTPLLRSVNMSYFKEKSSFYFFFHPIFVELGFFLTQSWSLSADQKGLLIFILTVVALMSLLSVLKYLNIPWEKYVYLKNMR